ncbi:MAG TPA: hypothetical protein VKE74_25830 [Gemmataceae bacterium]|nr:hypothetical protein [Gemmataceae bacterium]
MGLALARQARAARGTRSTRSLVEQVQAAPPGSPLKVDRNRGIIYGVKVLGRYSRNSHHQPGAEGTEYSASCMDDAVRRRLYEGVKVFTNHPPIVNGRRNAGAERSVQDLFGVLRNVKSKSGRDGQPGIYADLHYFKTHPLAQSVIEDVERGLGGFGLSHNAASDCQRERVDRATRHLVIECLAEIRSVDLVDRPATNRNLWESAPRARGAKGQANPQRFKPRRVLDLLRGRSVRGTLPRSHAAADLAVLRGA